MTVLQNSSIIAGASGNQGDYNIARSLRFRSSASAYLSRTPANAGNRKTWTYSTWVKLGALTSANNLPILLSAGVPGSNNRCEIRFNANSINWLFEYTSPTIGAFISFPNKFRDPSSWYHFVFVADTTNATSTDRLKIFVNGVRLTNPDGGAVYPSLNLDGFVNAAQQHYFGNPILSGYDYFDGYVAEQNFIDGQALTPSSFGSTNSQTGVWQPKKYTGTYGTNGFYLPFKYQGASTYTGSFNGSSQYLTVPQNAAFSFGTGDFTVETFVFANSWASVNPIIALGNGAVGGGSPIYSAWAVRYDSSGSLIFFRYDGVETTPNVSLTLATNQWHHIAVSRTSGVLKMFVNGAQVYSASSTTSYNNVNSDTLKIGGGWVIGGGVTTYLNGYISNTRIVKGTGLYTANFTPPSTNLTAVSGTSLLTLQNSSIIDSSTNAFTITNVNTVTTGLQNPFAGASIASDQSGNANNWQPNNISLTAGATYDSMKDVPTLTDADTANYCVMNPLRPSSYGAATLSEGNLKVSQSAGAYVSSTSTFPMSAGKWYWEVNCGTAGFVTSIGIASTISANGAGASGTWCYHYDGTKYVNGSNSAYGASYTGGDVLGFAFDASAGSLTCYKNGTSQGVLVSGLSAGDYYAFVTLYNSNNVSFNFGQRPFAYTPPTGFKSLNTYNLPAPTIGSTASTLASKNFDATLYTGNGSTQSIVNAGGFQPDMVWIKARSNAYNHYLFDSVRGATKYLSSNQTIAEGTNANMLNAFNSNGFSLGYDTEVNGGSVTEVAWQWKANGSAVTNTAGSITSQVSANASAGFSVVTYTGNASVASFGHGLGVAPKMIIIKNRSASGTGSNWCVGLNIPGWNWATDYLYLNTVNAKATDGGTTQFYSAPTSSVVNIGGGTNTNGSGNSMVAYCFSEVAGYSKFGSYTGNGSTDGPFVHLGFKPKFLIIKSISAASNWNIFDSSRDTYNMNVNSLVADAPDADANWVNFGNDFLSNGFKMRTNWANLNTSGNTYIYMAFAEVPSKYANAR